MAGLDVGQGQPNRVADPAELKDMLTFLPLATTGNIIQEFTSNPRLEGHQGDPTELVELAAKLFLFRNGNSPNEYDLDAILKEVEYSEPNIIQKFHEARWDAIPEEAESNEVQITKAQRLTVHLDLLHTELDQLKNNRLCIKCRKNSRQIHFLPCCHVVMCSECAEKSKICLYCRKDVAIKNRVFCFDQALDSY